MASTLADGAATVLAAAAALPDRGGLATEIRLVEEAAARGYFLPDEEELVRLRYSQYLALRSALLATLGELGDLAGSGKVRWSARLPVFVTAFAAACVLLRADRFLVDLAADKPVLWKKLDEPDDSAGIPRKTFTGIYKAVSHPVNLLRFLEAADFQRHHRQEINALADDPVVGPVVALLADEEAGIEGRRRDALKRHMAYRWFSFLRRHRSAWKKVMFGFFEVSGRAVAELRQPGVKPRGSPKRIDSRLRGELLALIRPGDVLVTRHDDALSNWFLPGFWPHAALYLGSENEARRLVGGLPSAEPDDGWFLESKKDGVKLRPARETLAVDALVVLRPPLADGDLEQGIRRAAGHLGKPYDFLFDFRTADRLVCTEVIYRGFHGVGPVRFRLKDVGGRLCLPAEDFIDQALDCGFQLVLTAGLGGDCLMTGSEADGAFQMSRRPA